MPIDPVAALGAYLRAQAHPVSRSHSEPARPTTGRPDQPAEPEPDMSVLQGPAEED